MAILGENGLGPTPHYIAFCTPRGPTLGRVGTIYKTFIRLVGSGDTYTIYSWMGALVPIFFYLCISGYGHGLLVRCMGDYSFIVYRGWLLPCCSGVDYSLWGTPPPAGGIYFIAAGSGGTPPAPTGTRGTYSSSYCCWGCSRLVVVVGYHWDYIGLGILPYTML